MIATQERGVRQEIFRSIRSSIQELHADKVILEDLDGMPFLFKSDDAKVWVRIFYRSMRDYAPDELREEVAKLWRLMPNDAVLYLFYPELDLGQILRLNEFGDRLSFFEYAGQGIETEKIGVRICKWMPASLVDEPSVQVERQPFRGVRGGGLLRFSRLDAEEVAALAELSLLLHRV